MCKNKCPHCGSNIDIGVIFSDALFNVESEPLTCNACKEKIKANYGASIAIAMLPQIFIIPFFLQFNLSSLQVVIAALIYIPIVMFLLICTTTFKLVD